MARSEPEKEQVLIVNLSGRGDKDIFTVADIFEKKEPCHEPLRTTLLPSGQRPIRAPLCPS